MNQIHPNKVGLSLGILLGGFHLLWALLVLFGYAQQLIDFIFKVHMIEPAYFISPFNLTMAVTLIIVTAIVGYIIGYIFALVWNKLHK